MAIKPNMASSLFLVLAPGANSSRHLRVSAMVGFLPCHSAVRYWEFNASIWIRITCVVEETPKSTVVRTRKIFFKKQSRIRLCNFRVSKPRLYFSICKTIHKKKRDIGMDFSCFISSKLLVWHLVSTGIPSFFYLWKFDLFFFSFLKNMVWYPDTNC